MLEDMIKMEFAKYRLQMRPFYYLYHFFDRMLWLRFLPQSDVVRWLLDVITLLFVET